jgi:hypothetical protein
MQSLYQGRPVSLQESDTRVPISFLDVYEEYEHWKPFAYNKSAHEAYSGSPAYSVSTFTGLCKLSVIMNRILNEIYAEATFDKSPEQLSELQKQLDSRLRDWHRDLPQHLKLEPAKPPEVIPPPHVLSLVAMYNVLLILLHRPFVSDGHLHSNARSITVNSLLVCANAATAIVQVLRLYHNVFSLRRAPYLMAYATYVSATIHIRIAAKRSSNSDAHKSLATCLEVFRVNQETNWAARRASAIVERLARKLAIELPDTSGALSMNYAEPQPTTDIAATPARPAEVVDNKTQNDSAWLTQGFSPTTDVDAIIQSFARDQDPNQQQFAQGMIPNSGMQMGPYDQTLTFPQDAGGIGGGWMPTADDFSFDDLLFGFNNSTMDQFGGVG